MTHRNGRPAQILLVEDDEADQELTRRALSRGKIANELHVVDDGEVALDYLYCRGSYSDRNRSPRPDLILLDLNLPRIDGREVLETIRADPDLRSLVVVVLTTSKQEEDILRSYKLGANSYITKPVDMEQFLRVVLTLEEYWMEVVVLPPRGNET